MAKETIINLDEKVVTTTFKTKINEVEVETTIEFDFSNIETEDVYALALRSVVIDFQRKLRTLSAGEVEAMDGTKVTVGEKQKRTETLSVTAFKKFNKGEELTLEEAKALKEALAKFTGISSI